VDLHAAIVFMFSHVVRYYRAHMPARLWMATCAEFLGMLLDIWGQKAPEALCTAASGFARTGDPQMEHMQQTKLYVEALATIATVIVAWVVYEELQLPPPPVRTPPMHAASRQGAGAARACASCEDC
jgi:hypothetical protein